MKRGLVSAAAIAAVVLSASAAGGRVNMPKEGSYEFDFCPIGRGKTFSAGDKLFFIHYDLDAVLRSNHREEPSTGWLRAVLALRTGNLDHVDSILEGGARSG